MPEVPWPICWQVNPTLQKKAFWTQTGDKKPDRGVGGARGCGYENLKITIIEQVEVGNSELLGKREIYWQNQLRCFIENGGKSQCKRKEK